jgi:hypothetical protein
MTFVREKYMSGTSLRKLLSQVSNSDAAPETS